ncbi:MAG TPA: DedA family protein [Halomonas sp.]|nr:DedA family protein [Halomonas sp.]
MEKLLQPLFELPSLTVYILIGLLCWTEAAFFLGFVTPGELAVVTGGILASRGQVEMDVLLGIVLVATVTGNATGFYLGLRWGGKLLGWAPLQRFLGPAIQKSQEFMARRGEWAIVLGRISTPTRIIVPFLAGASGVPYRRFVLFDIPASLVWAVVWAVLGFVLGETPGVAGSSPVRSAIYLLPLVFDILFLFSAFSQLSDLICFRRSPGLVPCQRWYAL